jgi:hypothetical protein
MVKSPLNGTLLDYACREKPLFLFAFGIGPAWGCSAFDAVICA